MLVLCSQCGYRLRAEVGSIGVFGMWDFFNDITGSDTSTVQVERCPGCGLWLYYGISVESGEAASAGSE